jgi:endonuclease/exonuclease/phosphatase family metal-dependent hydrolase
MWWFRTNNYFRMKEFYCLLLTVAVVLSISAQSINVMTFNIRMNTSSDRDDAWPYRRNNAANQILFHDVQILGVQEALHGQMMDLKERLTRFSYVGVGRDDGKEAGEYSAIFYDSTRLKLLHTQTFWLSEQPDVPGSKSWDAAITRIVTWARFKDRKTKKKFFVFNTHFDHIGKTARAESAKIILQKVKEIAGKKPVIVTGDFNSEPGDDPYKIITDNNNAERLTDSKTVCVTPHYGPTGTFNSFKSKETSNDPIDYIFVKNKIRVLKHATLSQSWQGHFSSDHFPVFATLSFK